MLLTITTRHSPATDMGFLLEKHPDKVHEFELSAGRATVFYPEATEAQCTVALLLEVDAIGLIRSGAARQGDPGLDQYVNDRPYAASGQGVVYTRTGRRFFNDERVEQALLARVSAALEAAGLYTELGSDWMVLDCELMPWSAKAQDLIRQQYAAVGAAGIASLEAGRAVLSAGATHLPELRTQLLALESSQARVAQYVDAYRRYCWSTDGLVGLKLAPFHLLASEGGVHVDRNHEWHMATLAKLAAADPELLIATAFRRVNLDTSPEVASAVDWWVDLTGAGDEGTVVKPLDFVARGTGGLLQPALKCRGREYLRIIYGPEYDLPQNLKRLRQRGLSVKRSLALREFCLASSR